MAKIPHHPGTTVPGRVHQHSDEAAIVVSNREEDLRQILNPNVQAVIYDPPLLPAWMPDLAVEVETGRLHIERTILQQATRDEIAGWLQKAMSNLVSPVLRNSLMTEILALVDRAQALTGASRLMMRIFTEAPSPRCGYHLDTVPPRSPTVGLLRVFNGRGTEYVNPNNVTNMRDFYRYFERRERLSKDIVRTQERHDVEGYRQTFDQITSLDHNPSFLVHADDVYSVPACAIVAFKHLDTRFYWSDHSKTQAWIHRSPMEGERRLVVNITAPGN